MKGKKKNGNEPKPCLVCGTPTTDGIINFGAKRGEDILTRLCTKCLDEHNKANKGEGPTGFHKWVEELREKARNKDAPAQP
jgi:hypothetical protein